MHYTESCSVRSILSYQTVFLNYLLRLSTGTYLFLLERETLLLVCSCKRSRTGGCITGAWTIYNVCIRSTLFHFLFTLQSCFTIKHTNAPPPQRYGRGAVNKQNEKQTLWSLEEYLLVLDERPAHYTSDAVLFGTVFHRTINPQSRLVMQPMRTEVSANRVALEMLSARVSERGGAQLG